MQAGEEHVEERWTIPRPSCLLRESKLSSAQTITASDPNAPLPWNSEALLAWTWFDRSWRLKVNFAVQVSSRTMIITTLLHVAATGTHGVAWQTATMALQPPVEMLHLRSHLSWPIVCTTVLTLSSRGSVDRVAFGCAGGPLGLGLPHHGTQRPFRHHLELWLQDP